MSTWRQVLPPEVGFCGGFETPAVKLTSAERLSLGTAGNLRIREFAAGRHQARRALATLGIDVAELLRGSSGAPAWPAGIVGSIAHTVERGRVYAVAAVARSVDIVALGIDVEPSANIEPRAWQSMFSEDELAHVLALPVEARGSEVVALWCAKEAVAKASGQAGDMRRIVVKRCGPDGRFGANLCVASVHGMAAGTAASHGQDEPCPVAAAPVFATRWEGCTAVASGRTFAVALRRPSGG